MSRGLQYRHFYFLEAVLPSHSKCVMTGGAMCRCEAVPLLATVGFTGFDDWSLFLALRCKN